MGISLSSVLQMIFQWDVIAALFGGSVIGIIIGAMPGLGPVTAQAVLLPLTFKSPRWQALPFKARFGPAAYMADPGRRS